MELHLVYFISYPQTLDKAIIALPETNTLAYYQLKVQGAPTSKLPSVPINIRLCVNALPGTNALAYYQLTMQGASVSKLPFINIRLGVNDYREKTHLAPLLALKH
jgi:hypothetical protein